MIEAPLTENEPERLAALRAYEILDTEPEEAFDDLTKVAARICGTPIALVSLIDEGRQWFKSRVGLDVTETPRSLAFCAHAILEPDDVMIVPDASQDSRFHDNPLSVGEPNVIFYAGAPLVTPEGLPLGTLCVIDHVPNRLTEEDRETLKSLARATVSQLELRRAALTLSDLTDTLAESNRDLERRNGEIRRFYQTLSHELKTPLTVARDYASMVLDGLAGEINEEQSDFLATSVENCDRIAEHVDDLLDLTRIETGKLRLNPAPIGIGDLVESVLTAMKPIASPAGVELTAKACPDLPDVVADPRRIGQVVTNLVRNAIAFTDPGGSVTVSAARRRDSTEGVEIEVRDTGRGIPAKDVEHIFDRLYQCPDDDGPSRRGLGLGLYLCRRILSVHGGDISVESAVGIGTTVRVRLPVRIPSPEAAIGV